MFSLAEENTVWALREKIPTQSGNLLILTFAKLVPEIRNTLAVSLPEGTRFEDGRWVLPTGGTTIWVRSFFEDIPKDIKYDLWVCTGGEVIPPEFTKVLGDWRKQDVN